MGKTKTALNQLIFSGERPHVSNCEQLRTGSFTFFIPQARTHASILNVDADCFRQSRLLLGWMCFVNAMNKMNPEIEPPVDLLNKRYMKLETRRASGFSPQQP